MGNIYYRKRFSNQKGFRLNLHGSRKGLSGSYSLYTKKKKGALAANWNSKTGVTLSIHGTGLRWMQSQKGKGKTGKTREQISKDSAAKKAAYRSGVESRKREREAKRSAKERERKIVQQEKLEAQIEKKVNSLASKALSAEDRLYKKAYKKFSDKIDKLIPSADECDTSEKFWSLTKKIDEMHNELFSEQKENSRYTISGVTQQYVKDNWGEVKSSLASQYQLTNAKLTDRGQLSLDLNELIDYYHEQKNILSEISLAINNYYYEETCNQFIDHLIENKPLTTSTPETVLLIHDMKVLIDIYAENATGAKKVVFENQNDETNLIKKNFIKNYFVHAIERIESESNSDSIDKNIFFEKHYHLLEILIDGNVEKIIDDESEYENINYAISIIAEVLSKNTQDKVEYYASLGEKSISLQNKCSEVFLTPIKFEPIFAVVNFKMIYALEEIVDEMASNEKNKETLQSITQKDVSIELFIQICTSINKFSSFIDFNAKESNEQKELILNSYADVRVSIFHTYYELHIEPLIAHINTDNIQELDKEIIILALPFIKLKKVISEKFIIKLNDEREKNYKICNQFIDDFVDYLIDMYAARIEELTDEADNIKAVDLIAMAPTIIDLNGDLKLITSQISSYMTKNFDKINNDIDKYIQEYCIKLKSNIQERKEIKDYDQDDIEKLDDSFENLKSIEKSYIPDIRIYQKKSLKNFEVSKKDKFLKLNHDKWLKIEPEKAKEVNGDILLNLKKLKKLCNTAKNDLGLARNDGEVLKFYYLAIYNELINLNYRKLSLKNKKFLSSFFSRTIYFHRENMKTYYHPVLRILVKIFYSMLALVIALVVAALLLDSPDKPKVSNTQQSSKKILDKKNTIDKSKTMVKEYKDNVKKKPNNNDKIINKVTKKKPLEQPKIVFKTIEYDTKDGKVVYSGGVDKNDVYQGFGKVRKNSKLVYEGEFKDGKWNGKGKQIFEDGVYEGKFKDGDMHGRGKLTFATGEIYEGAFKDGEFHGRGKLTYATGSIYEGAFEDGEFHGRGKLTYATGEIYEGALKDGEFHGRGKLTYANGDIYEGSWLNNKRHGNGQCFIAKSKKSFACSFKNGVMVK